MRRCGQQWPPAEQFANSSWGLPSERSDAQPSALNTRCRFGNAWGPESCRSSPLPTRSRHYENFHQPAIHIPRRALSVAFRIEINRNAPTVGRHSSLPVLCGRKSTASTMTRDRCQQPAFLSAGEDKYQSFAGGISSRGSFAKDPTRAGVETAGSFPPGNPTASACQAAHPPRYGCGYSRTQPRSCQFRAAPPGWCDAGCRRNLMVGDFWFFRGAVPRGSSCGRTRLLPL